MDAPELARRLHREAALVHEDERAQQQDTNRVGAGLGGKGMGGGGCKVCEGEGNRWAVGGATAQVGVRAGKSNRTICLCAFVRVGLYVLVPAALCPPGTAEGGNAATGETTASSQLLPRLDASPSRPWSAGRFGVGPCAVRGCVSLGCIVNFGWAVRVDPPDPETLNPPPYLIPPPT